MRDVIPLNPDYDDDDEAWARQYWKGPIVLMHGMGDNVDDWVNHAYGPHLILPFLLADIGYEVWSCTHLYECERPQILGLPLYQSSPRRSELNSPRGIQNVSRSKGHHSP